MATCAPSSARSRAVASPMPDAPPVIAATLPLNRPMSKLLSGGAVANSPREGVGHAALVPLRIAEVVEQRPRHLRVRRQPVLDQDAHAGVHLVSGVTGFEVGLAGHGFCEVNAGGGGPSRVELPQRFPCRPARAVEVVHQTNDVVLDALE